MNTVGANIRLFRKRCKMTLETLAQLVESDAGNLSRVETGKQQATIPLLNKLAEVLGVHPSEFHKEINELEEAPILRTFKNVPVVGTVQGGDQGYLMELDHQVGYGEGDVMYPAKDPNSYALRVRGDSMRPRIKNGEFIVVEPNRVAEAGDEVVVCLKDGRKMVKEYLYIRDGDYTFGSINSEHPNITVSADQIEVLHCVGGILPRGAFQPS